MTELALSVLDLAVNSQRANANRIEIDICVSTAKDLVKITIKDNGRGMSEDSVKNATNPFFTTRTTRRVGMGLALYRMLCESCGGSLEIQSVCGDCAETDNGSHAETQCGDYTESNCDKSVETQRGDCAETNISSHVETQCGDCIQSVRGDNNETQNKHEDYIQNNKKNQSKSKVKESGTTLISSLGLSSVNRPSLGDMGSTVVALISGGGDIRYIFRYSLDGKEYLFDTDGAKKVLGSDIADTATLAYIKEMINENIENINGGFLTI